SAPTGGGSGGGGCHMGGSGAGSSGLVSFGLVVAALGISRRRRNRVVGRGGESRGNFSHRCSQ
ncbi:MAG TPA: hypothetical protein VGF45_02365, partial [Polyangia bacterium]